MAEAELTQWEKGRLIGAIDARNLTDYDEEFYQLLKRQVGPTAEDIDNRIHRAMLKFTHEATRKILNAYDSEQIGIFPAIHATLLTGLIIGYEVGRKLKRPLTANPRNPG